METGNGLLSELAESMGKAQATAYVRATLTPTDDGWTVRYLEAVVGQRPPGWQVATWEYNAATFVAREISAAALADNLTAGTTLALNDRVGALPDLQPQCYWQQRPSLFRLDARRLPWPSIEWSLHATQPNDNGQWQPRSMLVSAIAPTFALFQVAHRAFYTGDFSSYGANQAPSDFGRIWVVEDSAWLHRVRVGLTHVDVTVKGTAAPETRIDIVGSNGTISKKVGRSGKVRLRATQGVEADAWLYLVDGQRCLDYRTFGSRMTVQDDLARQGVTFDVPDDPELEFTSLVGQIESPRLEYKRQLPDAQSVNGVMKTVAAFATGDGGDIVFGVEPDEITIVGLQLDDVIKQRDRLYQLVRDRITPAPAVEVEVVSYDDKTLMVLSVPAGLQPPYALADQPPRFYVRRGTHTVPARPDEIRDAILSRQPAVEDVGYPDIGPPFPARRR